MCVCVCVSVCLSVDDYSWTVGNEAAKERYQRVQRYTGLILQMAIFLKALRSKVMAKNTAKKPIC